tara:strand:- start:1611 stop:2033 length:423 start_codon:yes stop_codon:yes gene_type:complete
MDDSFMLKVNCPNDGSECSIVGGDVMESMVLLGDDEQNMQCLACGYASNNNMKTHIQPFPEDFKDVCVETDKGRYWAPSVFTTENYNVVPMVDNSQLKWRIFAHQDPKTEVVVPLFSDAFKMVEKLEKALGKAIQQQTNN